MKDFIINSIVEWTKYQDRFRLEFYAIITDDMQVPRHIKEQFGVGNKIMLVLNDKRSKPEFSFEDQMLYWSTAFGGLPFMVGVPVDAIFGVANEKGFILQFNSVFQEKLESDPSTQEKITHNEPKTPLQLKKHVLKLVIDNNEPQPSDKPKPVLLLK